jgi:hypothetical protein
MGSLFDLRKNLGLSSKAKAGCAPAERAIGYQRTEHDDLVIG